MSTFTKKYSPAIILSILVLGATLFFSYWHTTLITIVEAANNNEPTYQFSLTKKFSDVSPPGYTADQFKFHIEGTSATGTTINQTVDLIYFTDDTADNTVELPAGNYTVTEIGPASFVPGEWTVQWSGFGCENANSPSLFTTMTVSDDVSANVCRADNQWRHGKLLVEKNFVGTSTAPENFEFTVTQGSDVRYDGPFNTDGINSNIAIAVGNYTVTEKPHPDYIATYSQGCTGTMAQGGSATCTITNTFQGDNGGGGGNDNENKGVLVVEKVIVSTTTVPFSDFSFFYTGATVTTTFEASGSNLLSLATGTYSVTEIAAAGYTTTYNNCSDVVVSANATTTCTITNTLNTDNTGGGGGGGGGSDDDYRLQGYVWHDRNQDGVWDQEDGEEPLSGWTVNLTNGSTSKSTLTDESGFYSFIVGDGVWTVSETVMPNWVQTFPTSTIHVVVVPEDEEENEEQVSLRFPFNFFFSIAQAKTIQVNGNYNFGNVFIGGQGGGIGGDGGGGDGGGGSSSSRPRDGSGGGGNNSSASTPEPTPLVLGEQVSTIPQGGANTGGGGTAPEHLPLLPLLMATIILVATHKKYQRLGQ